MVNQLKVESRKLKVVNTFLFLLSFIVVNTNHAQIVEETIQLDTITEKMEVIYRPSYIHPTTHYTKKIAVYANDTSKVAIEKTYIRNKLNGIYKVFYPSGQQKVKAVYANGNPNGEFTWYNENGIIRIKGIYKDSVKHGFWAYKYLKVYGRYKRGKKHGKWYKVDNNDYKVKSWYKFGKLIKGKGFEMDDAIAEEQLDTISQPVKVNTDTSATQQVVESNTKDEIVPEYEQVVYYLKNNFILKKTLKAHFGKKTKDLWKFKKNYKSEVFQYKLSNTIMPLNIEHFMKKSNEGKIVVAKVDSVLKNTTDIAQKFASKKVANNNTLSTYSTKKDAAITVYFSEVIDNLIRVEIIWNKEEQEFSSDEELFNEVAGDKKFSILLYFNDKGELTAAEYQ